MIASVNSNNYHSMEAQVTLRPVHGISMQSTYTWSKNLGIFDEIGTYVCRRIRVGAPTRAAPGIHSVAQHVHGPESRQTGEASADSVVVDPDTRHEPIQV